MFLSRSTHSLDDKGRVIYVGKSASLRDHANDPAEQARIFGPGWTLKLEDRYMKRDPVTKQLILDAHGLPTPDPMVDTYMDNDNFDAASNDMAIRYRWTEGNKTGNWNFKPFLSPDLKTHLRRRKR